MKTFDKLQFYETGKDVRRNSKMASTKYELLKAIQGLFTLIKGIQVDQKAQFKDFGKQTFSYTCNEKVYG